MKFKKNLNRITTPVKNKISQFPLISFFILIGIIFLLILAGSYINEDATSPTEAFTSAKEVDIFSIGAAPTIIISAQIEKSGVVRIVSQSSGVIQKVNVTEGQQINRNHNIVHISSNYQGGSLESTQRRISQTDYYFRKKTFDQEIETIELRREQIEESEKNQDELRELSIESEKRTQEQVDLNNDLLNTVEENIKELEQSNISGINDNAIFQLKQNKAQLLSGNNQLKTSLDNSRYQTDQDNPPTALSEINNELALIQLDLEEKSKKLALKTSQLNLQLSRIREAQMYPVSPISGTVERVFVKPGQIINPGETIAIITGDKNDATAIALVSKNIANKISIIDDSKIIVGTESILLTPTYVSQEPTDGSLHSIVFNIPEEYSDQFTSNTYVNIEVPIGYNNIAAENPFIPVDSVFQTQIESYVYIARHDNEKGLVADIRPVQIGNTYGSYIEVKSGLNENDQIILNRNIVLGEQVIFAQ